MSPLPNVWNIMFQHRECENVRSKCQKMFQTSIMMFEMSHNVWNIMEMFKYLDRCFGCLCLTFFISIKFHKKLCFVSHTTNISCVRFLFFSQISATQILLFGSINSWNKKKSHTTCVNFVSQSKLSNPLFFNFSLTFQSSIKREHEIKKIRPRKKILYL